MLMIPRLILFFTITALYNIIPVSIPSSVSGKKICIDPGHGGTAETDTFRVGLLGEREEWVNLRVALMLKKMLKQSLLAFGTLLPSVNLGAQPVGRGQGESGSPAAGSSIRSGGTRRTWRRKGRHTRLSHGQLASA